MPKKFYCSNPAYIIVSGDENTPVADIQKAIKGTFAAMRKKGRNPVLVNVNDNACSVAAKAVADEQKTPVVTGDVATVVKELDGKRLNKENIQMILFQTPEYAGSEEALALLYGCRQFNGTLRMWSVFHAQWMNCVWSKDWVPDYNNRFLKTLNSYSMSEEEKRELFAKRIRYIQKYPTLYKTKVKKAAPKTESTPEPETTKVEPIAPVAPVLNEEAPAIPAIPVPVAVCANAF